MKHTRLFQKKKTDKKRTAPFELNEKEKKKNCQAKDEQKFQRNYYHGNSASSGTLFTSASASNIHQKQEGIWNIC